MGQWVQGLGESSEHIIYSSSNIRGSLMKTTESVNLSGQIEFIVSKYKFDLAQCLLASKDILRTKFGLRVENLGPILSIHDDEELICKLLMLDCGLLILEKNLDSRFVIVIKFIFVAMDEFSTKEITDLQLVSRIFDQDCTSLFTKEKKIKDEDIPEVTAMDEDFDYDHDATEEIKVDGDEEEESSEWI
jgi:hypothetical protein